MNKKLWIALFFIASIGHPIQAKSSSETYSCTAVLPDKIYVPPGETVIIDAQVDCFFLAFGSTIDPQSQPVKINIDQKQIQQIPAFREDEPIKLTGLQHFPAKGQLYAFTYKSIKNPKQGISLHDQPIEVVVRTEPISDTYKQDLQNKLKNAEQDSDTQQVTKLNQELANDTLIQIYRRLPSVPGQNKLFKPMFARTIAQDPQKEVADIHILPTGNLQIIEHTADGQKILVETAFGQL